MPGQTNAEADPAAALSQTFTPSAPWRVAMVRALPGFTLRVRFLDGTEGRVDDMAALINSPDARVFAALADPVEFARAAVELGAVTWPCGLDLAPDAMHDRIIADGGVWRLEP